MVATDLALALFCPFCWALNTLGIVNVAISARISKEINNSDKLKPVRWFWENELASLSSQTGLKIDATVFIVHWAQYFNVRIAQFINVQSQHTYKVWGIANAVPGSWNSW